MGEIHIVQGPASCGKTSTIKEIFGILDATNQNCIKEVYLFRDARKLWQNNQHQAMLNLIFKDKKDIKIEMQNVKTKNGKSVLVGIESQGDPPYKRLRASLDLFAHNGCDIIFCAERTSNTGVVANWVKSHPQYNIKSTTTLQKVVGSKQRQASNQNHAHSIITAAGL